MGHWFDRLASWSAPGDGEEMTLTRRQAVGAAATAAGAAGLLGSPLLTDKALGIAGGNSAACKCWDKADRINNNANYALYSNLGPASLVSPAVQFVLLTGLLTTSAAFLGQVANCGLCRDDPPLKPPPPKFQPCTQRGGIRFRGDQCGGNVVTPPPESGGCPQGTSDCGDGSLCCFGSDRCCGTCCCIVEIGCTCCG